MPKNHITSSAIIPFYNSEKFIDETLESLANQTRFFDEIIIVNDGSTSPEAFTKLRELEQRGDLMVIHQDNQGVAAALTVGAKAAKGDIIFEIDADDILLSQYVEKYLREFESDQSIDMVTSGYRMFFDGDDYRDTSSYYKSYMPEGYRQPHMFFYNGICGQNTAFRKKALEEVGYWSREKFDGPQDWGIGLSFFESNLSILVIRDFLYLYRLHENGFSQRIEKDHNFDEALRRQMGLILHKDKDYYTLEQYQGLKREFEKGDKRMGHRPKFRNISGIQFILSLKKIKMNIKKEGYRKTFRRILSYLIGRGGDL